MCDPVTVGVALGATLLSSAVAPKAPSMPAYQDPVKPPQAPKMPDQQGVRKATDAGGLAALPATMLSGPLGIDPKALNLGKNTLLGA